MAIEISPEAIRQKKTEREFRSPVYAFLSAAAAFFATVLVVWVFAWAWAEKNKNDAAELEKERHLLSAQRDPRIEQELQMTISRLAALDGLLENHTDGEQVFLKLEELIQSGTRVEGFEANIPEGTIDVRLESLNFVEAARQVAAFENDPQVLAVVASNFSKKAGTFSGIVSFQATLTLAEKVFRAQP